MTIARHPGESIKAVVFDLFGTLVHFPDDKGLQPHRKMFKELGLTPEEMNPTRLIYMTENFTSMEELAQCFRIGADIDFFPFEKELERDVASVIAYPETIEVLEKLQAMGIIIGLISNLGAPYKRVIDNLKLGPYFSRMIFSCDPYVGMVKPNPEIYQLMIRDLGIEPHRILMTGDQLAKDVDPPRQAGMQAVHLDRSGKSPNSISTLDGIFQYL